MGLFTDCRKGAGGLDMVVDLCLAAGWCTPDVYLDHLV